MATGGVYINKPADIFYKILANLHRWRTRLQCADQDQQAEWVSLVKAWVEEFREKLKDRPPEEDFI
jgi:hypothetical protein